MYESLLAVLNKEINKNNDNTKYTKELQIKIIKVLEDLSNIDTLDIDEIKIIFGEEEADKIKAYQILFSSKYFPITNSQKMDLVMILNVFLTTINEKITESSKIKEINKLKMNIENQCIDETDIDLLCEILVKHFPSAEERNEILQSLILKSLEFYGQLDIEDAYDEDDFSPSVTKEEVVELFNEYGYHFESLNDKSKKYILKYGKYLEMKNIFEVLKENKLKIIMEEYGSNFARILASSKGKIVEQIIENIKIDSQEENLQDYFELYLLYPSLFVSGNRKGKEITVGPGGDNKNNDKIAPGYENYLLNRELFIKLGVDINKAMLKCGTVFGTSHNKILENLECLKFYDIPREKYLKCISCLSAPNMAMVIDRLIELDCFDYLVNNLSITLKPKESPVFYKIKRHRLLGHDNKTLYFEKDTSKFKGDITNDQRIYLDINKENGPEITREYDLSKEFEKKYFADVEEIDGVRTIFLASKSTLVKTLENSMYKKNNLQYNFDGVIISRNKVLRYYETLMMYKYPDELKSLKYAIYKNSILTKEEYEKIEACLSSIYTKKMGGR